MSKSITKIIENQFHVWRHRETSGKDRTRGRRKKNYPVITVSREFGALGAALAHHMGEQLDFKVWDKELLLAIAKELGSDEKYLESVDERLRKPFEDAFIGVLMNINTNVNYLRALIHVVHTIEQFGNSIIVGRGGNFICQRPSSFHVRVVSPLKTRISGYANRENITSKEARTIIQQKDEERKEFVQHNFNKDVTMPSNYDLVLNSGVFSIQEMAGIVIEAYQKKVGMKVPVSGS